MIQAESPPYAHHQLPVEEPFLKTPNSAQILFQVVRDLCDSITNQHLYGNVSYKIMSIMAFS